MRIDDALDNVIFGVRHMQIPKGADYYWPHREFSKLLRRNHLRLVWREHFDAEPRPRDDVPRWVMRLLRLLRIVV